MKRFSARGKGVSLARGSAGLAAVLGIVMLFASVQNASAASQTPNIFGIWIGIDSKSPNFGPQWRNKPNTPTPEFTAWGAEQSREQGRLGVELPTPGACEPVNPAMFVGGGLFPNQILQGHNQIVLMKRVGCGAAPHLHGWTRSSSCGRSPAQLGGPLYRPLGRRHAYCRHRRSQRTDASAQRLFRECRECYT